MIVSILLAVSPFLQHYIFFTFQIYELSASYYTSDKTNMCEDYEDRVTPSTVYQYNHRLRYKKIQLVLVLVDYGEERYFIAVLFI